MVTGASAISHKMDNVPSGAFSTGDGMQWIKARIEELERRIRLSEESSAKYQNTNANMVKDAIEMMTSQSHIMTAQISEGKCRCPMGCTGSAGSQGVGNVPSGSRCTTRSRSSGTNARRWQRQARYI